MLEGLDRVEWANLWACGRETEVPKHLRDLTSPDPAVRKQASEELPTTLVYQGMSTLETASYAVPFLLELLAAPVVEEEKVDPLWLGEKGNLLWLLSAIAKGRPFLLGTGALDRYEDEASAPPDLQAELASQRGWVQRAYGAVEQGVALYCACLAHAEAGTRLAAAHLLALFPAQERESILPLRARLDQEEDERVLATVVVSLGTLLTPEATALAFLGTYVQADYPPRLRLVAALTYARRARATTLPEVIQVLVEAGREPESQDPSLMEWLFIQAAIGSSARLRSTLCEALAQVDPILAVPALIAILHVQLTAGADENSHVQLAGGADANSHYSLEVVEFVLAVAFSPQVLRPFHRTPLGKATSQQIRRAIHEVWYEDEATVDAKLEAVNALLGVAFPQESPVSAAPLARPGAPALTPVQRAALDGLVNEGLLWGSDFGGLEQHSLRILLSGCGLPASRDGLRALLERPGATQAEPLAPTLTPLQYRVVNTLDRDVLWEREPDLRLGLEQLLMSYGLPSSRAALRDLLLE